MNEQTFFTLSACAGHSSPFGSQQDVLFMQHALMLAHKAACENEIPIGALVVDSEGKILGRGYNRVEGQHTQMAHAEIDALMSAANSIGNWRLSGCWLYVSLEPCTMCLSAIRLSRIAGIVFGADSPLYGYRLDNVCRSPVYNNDTFVAISGVCMPESAQILKDFFKKKRRDSDKEVSGDYY